MTPALDPCRRASLAFGGMRRRRPGIGIDFDGDGGEPALLGAKCFDGDAGREWSSAASRGAHTPVGGNELVAGEADLLRGQHAIPPCAPSWSGIVGSEVRRMSGSLLPVVPNDRKHGIGDGLESGESVLGPH